MVPWSEVAMYYQIGNVFVTASKTETQGLTVIEGMAASLPVVCMEDDSFKIAVIDGYNGMFFKNKREYVKYFELVKPHLTQKALIVADNITSHAEKVQTFIDAIDADDEFQYEIVDVPGGILIAYRG